MSDHADLPPSSAGEWSQCGGWLNTTQRALDILPDTPSDEAREGDAAHAVAASILLSYKSGERVLSRSDFIDQPAPNGVVVTDAMYNAVHLYVNTVLSAVGGNLSRLNVERRVAMYDTVHPKNYGTPDCWFFDPVAETVHLYDFKYGHSGVNAFENWQAINYIAGIIETHHRDAQSDTQVIINIVQPRRFDSLGPVKQWRCKLSDLQPHIDTLGLAAETNVTGVGDQNVGKHCKNCAGKLVCEKFNAWEAGQVDVAGESLPYELSPELADYQLSKLDTAIDLLRKKSETLEAYLQTVIDNGGTVQSRHVVETLARANKYKVSDDQVIKLGDVFGVDLRKPEAPVSPKDAEKMLKDVGAPADTISTLYHRPKTGFKLKPSDHTVTKELFSR